MNVLDIYHRLMEESYKALDKPIPVNKDAKRDEHQDKLLRELDCALIEFMHESIFTDYQAEIAQNNGISKVKLFDSTRGVFTEGGPAFPGSEIRKKSHIQICIRNMNSIKGFFLPRDEYDFVHALSEESVRKKVDAKN